MSIVLSLLGFDVDCVCYSDYLSRRDYEEFKNLFELFGVAQNIGYQTFEGLAELLGNPNGCKTSHTLAVFFI